MTTAAACSTPVASVSTLKRVRVKACADFSVFDFLDVQAICDTRGYCFILSRSSRVSDGICNLPFSETQTRDDVSDVS